MQCPQCGGDEWSKVEICPGCLRKTTGPVTMRIHECHQPPQDQALKALKELYATVPALGHHQLPDYECPNRQLARAMNMAAVLLGKPRPYPHVPTMMEVRGVCPECRAVVPPGFYTCNGSGSHPAI
jgi:hypothetical protein